MNPGRPASTGPKPVPFGLSGTPAYKKKGYIETIKNLNKFLNAPAGIRTRVFGSKGRNDWPDYTIGAKNTNAIKLDYTMGPMGFEPMTSRL